MCVRAMTVWRPYEISLVLENHLHWPYSTSLLTSVAHYTTFNRLAGRDRRYAPLLKPAIPSFLAMQVTLLALSRAGGPLKISGGCVESAMQSKSCQLSAGFW
jgi:hypothetical protein